MDKGEKELLTEINKCDIIILTKKSLIFKNNI